MKDLGITKKDWKVIKHSGNEESIVIVNNKKDQAIAFLPILFKDSEANAKLIADAGTTTNKCRLLPSELLEQREEMLGLFENIVEYWNGDRNDKAMFDALNHIIYESEQLIQKITKP